jgi:hypothetical protein
LAQAGQVTPVGYQIRYQIRVVRYPSGQSSPAIWRISSSENLSSHQRRIAGVTFGFTADRHRRHLGVVLD